MKFIAPSINGAGRAGHQFTQMVAAYSIARKYDLTYIHTPFIGKQAVWNKLFTVRGVPCKLTTNLKKILIPHKISVMKLGTKGIPILESIIKQHSNCLFKCAMDLFMKVDWPSVRQLNNMYTGPKALKRFVAVHIRRGDISKIGNTNRWVEIDHYSKILQNIRDIDKHIPINIYSDGTYAQLKKLDEFNVRFYLNTDTEKTMHSMINACILVTSKSTFCLLALYSSKGLKLSIPFPPYWYDFPDRSDICPISESGNFNKNMVVKWLQNI